MDPMSMVTDIQDDDASITYSHEQSTVWRNALPESTPSGTLVTLLPLRSQYEIFSNFGDKDCGEPSRAQHIVLDFTPDPVIDNKENQLKCIAFWDFVHTQPQLLNMFVSPETPESSEHLTETKTSVSQAKAEEYGHGVSILQKQPCDFMSTAFNVKRTDTKCTLGDASYSEDDPTVRRRETLKSTVTDICKCSGICAICKKSRPARGKSQSKDLSKVMNEWDKTHPKPNDDPGPIMQHMPILQRKLPPPQEPRTCLDFD